MRLWPAVMGIFALSSAGAQTCQGGGSFRDGPLAIGAEAAFTDGSKGYGASLAVGTPQGLFVDGGVARIRTDGSDETTTSYGGALGLGVSFDSAKRSYVCPYGLVGYTVFPGTATATTFGGGFAIGTAVPVSSAVSVIPFGSFSYVETVLDPGNGAKTIPSDGGAVGFGMGFAFNRVFVITPSGSFPVGVNRAKSVFSIRLALHLGTASE